MTAMAEAGDHRPVMLAEVMHALDPRDEGVYVDGTFGGGGYSRTLLEAAHCTVWGIDRDPEAIERGAGLARQYPGRLTLIKGRFGDMVGLLRSHQVATVDGVALDLGLSSLQLDDPERGFSFRLDGPLDMRMPKGSRVPVGWIPTEKRPIRESNRSANPSAVPGSVVGNLSPEARGR